MLSRSGPGSTGPRSSMMSSIGFSKELAINPSCRKARSSPARLFPMKRILKMFFSSLKPQWRKVARILCNSSEFSILKGNGLSLRKYKNKSKIKSPFLMPSSKISARKCGMLLELLVKTKGFFSMLFYLKFRKYMTWLSCSNLLLSKELINQIGKLSIKSMKKMGKVGHLIPSLILIMMNN